MATTKYSKYRPDPFEDMDLSDLVDELSDYLLDSGFDRVQFSELSERTMQSLREALLKALLRQGTIGREDIERLMGDAESFEDSELRQLLDRLIQRMQDEGFIRISPPDPDLTAAGDPDAEGPGEVGMPRGNVKFELTDKSIDFLGFKALRGLLGGLGKASFGQHETKELATGVEVVGSSKPYEFG
ncbi:MAG: hypothetical protein ACRD1Z_00310, partial [Vicinamibacteria bacterium]